MNLIAKLLGRHRHRATGCTSCGASTLQLCKVGCPNRLNRGVNAPRCYDGLHSHCPLKPFCTEECKNDQRTSGREAALMDAKMYGSGFYKEDNRGMTTHVPTKDVFEEVGAFTQTEVDALMSANPPIFARDGLIAGTNGIHGPGGAGVAVDLHTLANAIAAYGLNLAYGSKLAPFELEHLTKLAAQVGCRVTPRQLQHSEISAVLEELLAERQRQIALGYNAAYDDAHPLHGRMEALHRLNDPNHTDKDIVEAAAILVADLERRRRNPIAPTGTPPGYKETYNGHVLYEQGDQGIPPSLLDQNGDIVLGVCKVCGAAEIELEVACMRRKVGAE